MSFGKLIPLLPNPASPIPDAKSIMDRYDKILKESKDPVVKALIDLGQQEAASYYGNLGKAYIFDIQLLQDYLANVGTKANYITLLNALQSNRPTMVFSAAHSTDQKNFFLVANSQGEVPEHPEQEGTIGVAHGLDGRDTIVFSI
jgi:hypothetical protein